MDKIRITNKRHDTAKILRSYALSIESNIFDSKTRIPADIICIINQFYGHHNYRLHGQTDYESSPLNFTIKTNIIENPYKLYRGVNKLIYQNWKNEIFVSGASWNKWDTKSNIQPITTINDVKNKNGELINFDDINIENDYISIISEGLNSSFTLMVSNNKKIYGMGYNFKIAVSLKDILANIEQTLINHTIKKIVCGNEHFLILTTNGTVFSMGNNHVGQCGVTQNNRNITIQIRVTVLTKIKLDNIIKIKDISCGSFHNLLLSENNKLWIFGKNQSGEIGLGKGSQFKLSIPMINPLLSHLEIMRIECGSRHSLCITNDYKCFLFGRNGMGQCGKGVIKSSVHRVKTPYLLQSFSTEFANILIEDGSLGNLHTILLTKDNRCITFGCNNSKQCTHYGGSLQCIRNPYYLSKFEIGIHDKERILRVVALKYSTLIIISNS